VEKNKQWLGSNAKLPSSVAMTYLDTSGLMVNQVDTEIDWEFFQETGTGTGCAHSPFPPVAQPDQGSLATPSPTSFICPTH
jgi:hypothetical protein